MTISLQTAKELQEAGWPHKTEFYYYDTRKSWDKLNCQLGSDGNYYFLPFQGIDESNPEVELINDPNYQHGYNIAPGLPVPTTDELLEELSSLPGGICLSIINDDKDTVEYEASYEPDADSCFWVQNATPAEALARLWIELKTNNLI